MRYITVLFPLWKIYESKEKIEIIREYHLLPNREKDVIKSFGNWKETYEWLENWMEALK